MVTVKLVICLLAPIVAVAVGQDPVGNSKVAVTPGLAVNVNVGGTEYVAVVAAFKYTDSTTPLFTVTVKLAVARAVPETKVPPVTVTVGAVV